MATDLPLPAYDDRLPRAPNDAEALVALSTRWGLDSPLNRLLAALGWGGAWEHGRDG